MNFERFLNTLVLAYIEHDFIRGEMAVAGIDVDLFPPELMATQLLTEFHDRASRQSWELTQSDMQNDLNILRLNMGTLSELPKNPTQLAERFNQMLSRFEIAKLGERLYADPEKGEAILAKFKMGEAKSVESFDAIELLKTEIDKNHEAAAQGKAIVKIKGFENLSEMIGGFNPERIGILLGATGFGKTNAAINLAVAAGETMGVGYVNMEMGKADIAKRIYVIAEGVLYEEYARGENRKPQHPGLQNLRVTSGRALTLEQISAQARLWAAQHEIKFLVVDYDQKIEFAASHRFEEWKQIQKAIEALEELAKELNLYCLVLAQVNREGAVSGSFRSTFPAHTVLQFHEVDDFGVVIEAKKNRHGKRNQAVTVLYNQTNSRITEMGIVTLTAKKAPAKKATVELPPPGPKKPKWP